MLQRMAKKSASSRARRAGQEAAPVPSVGDTGRLPRHAFADLAVEPPGGRPRPSRTGLPDRLQQGVEALSGLSLDGIKVHYNSPAPARLGALAYARGREIHVAPGQERHLPHEAWHLVQQAQGRVRPTARSGSGESINHDPGLEREADRMGARAHGFGGSGSSAASPLAPAGPAVIQPVLRVDAVGGGRNRAHRRKIVGQLNAILPPGVHAGIDRRTGHVRLNGAAPGAAHAGYDLVNRMIGHAHTVRVTPTDTNAGGVIRGRPENPQAPSLLANPGGWMRHHLYGFLGNFSQAYSDRQAFAAAGDPNRGADHQIFHDPHVVSDRRQVRVHDPVLARSVTETAPTSTILAHELIHADRTQRGQTSVTPQGGAKRGVYDYARGPAPGGGGAHWWDPLNPTHDQEPGEIEEMETVGIPSAGAIKPTYAAWSQRPDFVGAAAHAPHPANITENQIRALLGRRNRDRYP